MMISKRLSRLFKKKIGNNNFLSDLKNYLEQDTIKDSSILDGLSKLPSVFEQVDNIFDELDKKIDLANTNLHNSTSELSASNMELYDLNLTMNAMVNSLDQAFFIFDQNGKCQKIFSKKCEELFHISPLNSCVEDVLNIQDRAFFKSWIDHLFSEILDFDDIAQLGPDEYINKEKSLIISLKYKPLKSNSGKLKGIVLIGSDVTIQKEALKQIEENKESSKMIIMTIGEWDNFISFFDYYKEIIVTIKAMDLIQKNNHQSILRILHTIKGAAATLSITKISNEIHELETEYIDIKKEDRALILEFEKKLPNVLDQILEQLFKENHLVFKRYLDVTENNKNKNKNIKCKNIVNLYNDMIFEKCSATVLESFFKNITEINLNEFFVGLSGQIEMTSLQYKKDLRYSVNGDDNITIAKKPYQVFFSNLIHLINNCIYHGIELPFDRKNNSKIEKGLLQINFEVNEQNRLLMEVSDDGAGIDTKKLKIKMNNLNINTKGFTDVDYLNGIFLDGVSTEDSVNKIAGRGVGMSSLKESILEIGGNITVKSELHKGSIFYIDLPLLRGKEYFNS